MSSQAVYPDISSDEYNYQLSIELISALQLKRRDNYQLKRRDNYQLKLHS